MAARLNEGNVLDVEMPPPPNIDELCFTVSIVWRPVESEEELDTVPNMLLEAEVFVLVVDVKKLKGTEPAATMFDSIGFVDA